MENKFSITPFDKNVDLENESKFKRLELTDSEKIQLSGLISQIPSTASINTVSGMWTLKFPAGVDPFLMSLKSGGYSTVLIDANGKITGTAALFPPGGSAAFLNVFSALSIVTSQYYLALINKELSLVNQKLDKVLEFLYGDKKAELLASLNFVKRAQHNFNSIMRHEEQRIATLTNLQECGRIALKDIEFYISDLENTAQGEMNDERTLARTINNTVQIKESLELSLQLYIMCCVMEIYFSRNTDKEYISFLEEEGTLYIDKCNARMIGSFSKLSQRIDSFQSNVLPVFKADKTMYEKKISIIIDDLHDGNVQKTRKALHESLISITKPVEIIVGSDNSVYYRK